MVYKESVFGHYAAVPECSVPPVLGAELGCCCVNNRDGLTPRRALHPAETHNEINIAEGQHLEMR